MWTSFTSWLSPGTLFLVVNIVVATIAVTSRLGARKTPQRQLAPPGDGAPQLVRAPSLLERVRSFNFSPHYADTVYVQSPVSDSDRPNPDPPPQLARTPSVLERLKSIRLSSLYRSDSSTQEAESPQPTEKSSEKNHEAQKHSVNRSKSDSGSLNPSPATSIRRRLMKSLSEKLAWTSLTATPWAGDEEADRIERSRPATSRAGSSGRGAPASDHDEVNAKADDFINRFKQQLRLQRLESLLRNRDTINGN